MLDRKQMKLKPQSFYFITPNPTYTCFFDIIKDLCKALKCLIQVCYTNKPSPWHASLCRRQRKCTGCTNGHYISHCQLEIIHPSSLYAGLYFCNIIARSRILGLYNRRWHHHGSLISLLEAFQHCVSPLSPSLFLRPAPFCGGQITLQRITSSVCKN